MIRLFCRTCGLFAEMDGHKSRKRTSMNAAWTKRGGRCPCGAVTFTETNEVDPYPNEDQG